MKQLKYKVEFLSDWLCGSGLSSGNNADIIPVVEAITNLPYIPGKTIKGLIREQLDILGELEGDDNTKKTSDCIEINGNAEIEENIEADLIPYLYRDLAGVKIDERGLAVDKSLRVKKVVVPITLYGQLSYDDNKIDEEFISRVLKMIKSLGVGRNKGLGRCRLSVINN